MRAYFLFLRQQKNFSGSAMSIGKAAFQLFFREHLGHADWKVFTELVIRRTAPLPLVLSREEVQRTLGTLREERFRVCLRLIYHCGLRVGEAVRIKVHDLDAGQLRLHIRLGKGGKDRCVPVTPRMIAELRAFWKTHRNPVWLFPAPGRPWRERSEDRNAVLGRDDKALGYLAQYVQRTALSSQRILKEENGRTTFKYRQSDTGAWKLLTLETPEFLRRFLQHVLPTGFHRIRYFGWWSPAAKTKWQRILALLDWKVALPPPQRAAWIKTCRCCGQPMERLGQLPRAPPP